MAGSLYGIIKAERPSCGVQCEGMLFIYKTGENLPVFLKPKKPKENENEKKNENENKNEKKNENKNEIICVLLTENTFRNTQKHPEYFVFEKR